MISCSLLAICDSGISYDIESDTRAPTGMSGIMQKNPGTEQECKDQCNEESNCWGFLFNPTVPKCVMYDQYDDPFRTDNDQIYVSGEDLYMKRCDFDCKILFCFSFTRKQKINKQINK